MEVTDQLMWRNPGPHALMSQSISVEQAGRAGVSTFRSKTLSAIKRAADARESANPLFPERSEARRMTARAF
jgi:hypothetical protein